MADDEKPLPEWKDIKKVLDDPEVPDDQKRDLALAYGAEDDWRLFGTRDEVEPYLEKYDDGYWRVLGEGISNASDRQQNLRDKFDTAKKSADEAGEKRKKNDEAVDKGKATLEDSKRKAENGENGGAGAKTGDELLDAGNPGMKFFDTWLPLYKKIQSYKNAPQLVPELDEIKKRYDEQRELNFDKFAKNIDDLKAAEKGMRESMQTMSDKMSGLWKSWTGAASDASQDFFSAKFTPTAQERVIATVSDAASMTEDTVKAVAEMIRAKAEAVLGYNEQVYQIAGKAKSDWDITIQVGNGTEDDMILKQACAIWDVQIDDGCWGDLTDKVKDQIEEKCRDVTRESFCAKGVEAVCESFTKLCDETKKNIDEAWKKLNDELSKAEENPFQNPGGKDGGGDKPNGDKPAGDQGGGNTAGGGGGTGAGGGGTSGGGGGGGGIGEGGGGGIPKPPDAPEMPKPPEMPMPGEGGGGGSTGDQEKVTLGEGKDAVSVQEPGPDGKTKVEVMGPDGKPKTYEVDFGKQDGSGQPGTGAPQTLPGQAGQVPGPGGAPGVGGQGPEQVQAGPDGKAVIEEDGRTLTLERTPEGQIKVSVDNGNGQPPMNQTIEFGKDSPGMPTPGGPAGTMPEASTMPAPDNGPGVPGQGGAGAMPVGEGGFGPAPGGGGAPGPADGSFGSGAGGVGGGAGGVGGGGVTTMPAFNPDGAPGGVGMDTPAATTPQAAGMSSFTPMGEGVQNSFGSSSGQLFGGDAPGPQPGGGIPGQHPGGATGVSSFGDAPAGGKPQGATGVSSMGGDPAAGPPQSHQQGQNPSAAVGGAAGGAGGGGMMGGMGMMGGGHGGQQGGGEQERSNSSPWRTQGQLFDDGVQASNVRFQSVLGEDREK
ncbi:WXG100 family type VII secretion target [Saccharopolyspora sp. NPDC002376]